MDVMISQTRHRLSGVKRVAELFQFLSATKLMAVSHEELEVACRGLADTYNSDISGDELFSELSSARSVLQDQKLLSSGMSFADFLGCLVEHDLSDHVYPNLSTALRLFLTIPVTVASSERSFSKLKLIKNYLRSSMGQERLSDLAVLSIEHEAASELDYDNVITAFANEKVRRARHF